MDPRTRVVSAVEAFDRTAASADQLERIGEDPTRLGPDRKSTGLDGRTSADAKKIP